MLLYDNRVEGVTTFLVYNFFIIYKNIALVLYDKQNARKMFDKIDAKVKVFRGLPASAVYSPTLNLTAKHFLIFSLDILRLSSILDEYHKECAKFWRKH